MMLDDPGTVGPQPLNELPLDTNSITRTNGSTGCASTRGRFGVFLITGFTMILPFMFRIACSIRIEAYALRYCVHTAFVSCDIRHNALSCHRYETRYMN